MARYEIADDGIPGLTLALRLRIKGHKVALVPAEHSELSEQFTLPAPYRDLFLKSGGALEKTTELLPASERSFSIDGVALTLPAVGPHSISIGAAFGDEAGAQWAAFIRSAADIWGAVRTGPYSSSGSLHQLAKPHLRDRRLQQLLRLYVTDVGLDARRVGDAAAVLPYLEQTFGRWQFIGGLASIEEDLRRRCASLGVEHESNGGDYLDVGAFWASTFTAPPRRWHRGTPVADTRALGLPWVGMAAEMMADRIGRATHSNPR